MACHPRQRKREGPDGDKWSKTTKDTLGGMESERVPTEPSQTSPHHQKLNIRIHFCDCSNFFNYTYKEGIKRNYDSPRKPCVLQSHVCHITR